MNRDENSEAGSYEADYESDFDEVELVQEPPKEKAIINKNEIPKLVSQAKDLEVMSDESYEYLPKPKAPAKVEKSDEEENYDDSFNNYSEEENFEPKVAKPDITKGPLHLDQKKQSRPDYEQNLSDSDESQKFKNAKVSAERVIQVSTKRPEIAEKSIFFDLPKKDANAPSKEHVKIASIEAPVNESSNPFSLQQSSTSTKQLLKPEALKKSSDTPILKNSPRDTERISKQPTFDKLKSKSDLSQKKNRQLLEKENQKLRMDLKALNEQLSLILDNATAQLKSKPKQKSEPKIKGEMVIDKRLKIYIAEYNKIKERYEKIGDSSFLIELKQEIKSKEKKVELYEKRLKKMGKDQLSRGNEIINFDDKTVLEDRINYQSLLDELTKIQEQIDQMEVTLEKEHEWYENNYEKEVGLQERYEKLKSVVDRFNLEPAVDKSLQTKHDEIQSVLQNLEKTHASVINQLKVQENSFKAKKDSIFKELKSLQEQYKKKTDEYGKARKELEDVSNVAMSSNMSRLVSLLNQDKRPASERSISPQSETEKNSQKTFKDSRQSKREVMSMPRNNSSNRFVSEMKNQINTNDQKPFKDKSYKISLQEDAINKQQKLLQSENDKEFTHPDQAIVEIKNEDKKSKRSIFQELEEETKDYRIAQDKSKLSNFGELNLYKDKEPKNADEKSSIYNELPTEPKLSHFSNPVKSKPSIFQELEQNKPVEASKPAIFQELMQEKLAASKPSIFQELENDKNHNSLFKPIEINKKSGLFAELEESSSKNFAPKEAEGFKPSIFRELEPEPDSHKENDLFKPFKPNISGASKPELSRNIADDKEIKANPFGGIELSDPSSKRNREHLQPKVEKKEEKLAENAAKHDIFGDLFDSNESKPISTNFQTKLLPIRMTSNEPMDDKKPEVEIKPKKPTKNYDLEEEDLIL